LQWATSRTFLGNYLIFERQTICEKICNYWGIRKICFYRKAVKEYSLSLNNINGVLVSQETTLIGGFLVGIFLLSRKVDNF